MSRRRGPFGIGMAVAAAAVVLDQLSKSWIVGDVMVPPRRIELTSFFNLVLAHNRGISFGMFNTDSPLNGWILPGVALVVVVFLVVWLRRTGSRFTGLAIGLVIGGALGNVMDRLRYGAVVDFLDFHVGAWHWPAFNLADSAITVGAALLIAESLFARPEAPKNIGPTGNKRNDGP